ncbi:MAG: LamG domain-containing protein [Bacteroidota bacterium]
MMCHEKPKPIQDQILSQVLRSLLLAVVLVHYVKTSAQDGYLSFDGNNDYIALPISHTGQNAIATVSVEAWVRTSFTNTAYNSNWAIVDFDRSDFYNVFIHGDGRVAFSTYAPTGGINDFYGNTIVNDGQWHHIAVVYDGTNKMIYVDGELDATRTNPHGGMALGKNTTRFGFIGDGSEASGYNATRNNLYYHGDISELRIWNRVLTPAELDVNKLPSTPSGSEAGLFAYYTFDDGSATDLGPNSFDGGIFNNPIFNDTDGVPGPTTGGGSVWSANGNTIFYNTGNIAMGRSSVPSGYRLAVEGKIRTREVRVDADTWPDYVFDKDYALPTLQEVKDYIDKNGHLPKIPSAAEVEANGIELGMMNKRLLEKMEELTLYTLQQQQALEAAHQANSTLGERLLTLEKQIQSLLLSTKQ